MKTCTPQAEVLRRLLSPTIICSAFILCAALGMLINPESFHKFFSSSQLAHNPPPQLPHRSYYWDVEHYANMALTNICTAFYPLWPLLIRDLFQPQTVEQAAHSFLLLGTILAFIAIFLLLYVLELALETKYLAFLLVLAYALNPMAIFRFIGYTESVFSIFSIIFAWCFVYDSGINKRFNIILLSLITLLMSLTRPTLIQISFSAFASLLTIFYFAITNSGRGTSLNSYIRRYKAEVEATITLCASAIVGYSIYGLSLFCHSPSTITIRIER